MKRNTWQQTCVRKELRERTDHPTVHDLHADICRKHDVDIHMTTLYRILERMIEAGEVTEIKISNQHASRFDPNTDPHWHFICDECGTVYDIPISKNPKSIVRALESYGTAHSYAVSARGVCARCEKK